VSGIAAYIQKIPNNKIQIANKFQIPNQNHFPIVDPLSPET
jgi:hypothetical protein